MSLVPESAHRGQCCDTDPEVREKSCLWTRHLVPQDGGCFGVAGPGQRSDTSKMLFINSVESSAAPLVGAPPGHPCPFPEAPTT